MISIQHSGLNSMTVSSNLAGALKFESFITKSRPER